MAASWMKATHRSICSDKLDLDALDLVQRDLVVGSVVELGGPRRLVCRDLLGVLERAAHDAARAPASGSGGGQ